MIVHAGIASATKTPELVIDSEESDLLAEAATNVMAEFDVTPDPKTQAIVGAIVACASVYGPRVVTIRMRKTAEAKAKASKDTATVYNADGSFAGETTFSETVKENPETNFTDVDSDAVNFSMPAGKGGT